MHQNSYKNTLCSQLRPHLHIKANISTKITINIYRKSNIIRRALLGNEIIDRSDVVG